MSLLIESSSSSPPPATSTDDTTTRRDMSGGYQNKEVLATLTQHASRIASLRTMNDNTSSTTPLLPHIPRVTSLLQSSSLVHTSAGSTAATGASPIPASNAGASSAPPTSTTPIALSPTAAEGSALASLAGLAQTATTAPAAPTISTSSSGGVSSASLSSPSRIFPTSSLMSSSRADSNTRVRPPSPQTSYAPSNHQSHQSQQMHHAPQATQSPHAPPPSAAMAHHTIQSINQQQQHHPLTSMHSHQQHHTMSSHGHPHQQHMSHQQHMQMSHAPHPPMLGSHHKSREGPPRIAIRVKLACSNCKASKTKCDDERPCRRCIRTDRQHTCVDSERTTMENSSDSDAEEHAKMMAQHLRQQQEVAMRQQQQQQQAVAAQHAQMQQQMSAGPQYYTYTTGPPQQQSQPIYMQIPGPPPTYASKPMMVPTSSPMYAVGPPPQPTTVTAPIPQILTQPPSVLGKTFKPIEQQNGSNKKPKLEDPTSALAHAALSTNGVSESAPTNGTAPTTNGAAPASTTWTRTDTSSPANGNGNPSDPSTPAKSSTSPPPLSPAQAPTSTKEEAATNGTAATATKSESTAKKSTAPPLLPFCSPATPAGRQWLETLIMSSLPQLHSWQAQFRTLQEQYDTSMASPSTVPPEQLAQQQRTLSMARKRVEWLQSFFRFMHGGGGGYTQDAKPDLTSTLAVPKHLYGQLQLGVLLFPLGHDGPMHTPPWVNSSLTQLLGYQSSSQLEELFSSIDGIATINHPQNLSTYIPSFIDAVMQGNTNYSTKTKWRHRLGHWVELLESINLTYDPVDGSVVYVASLMQVIQTPAAAPVLMPAGMMAVPAGAPQYVSGPPPGAPIYAQGPPPPGAQYMVVNGPPPGMTGPPGAPPMSGPPGAPQYIQYQVAPPGYAPAGPVPMQMMPAPSASGPAYSPYTATTGAPPPSSQPTYVQAPR